MENAYGPNHPDVARILKGFALLLYTPLRHEEAKPRYLRVVQVLEKILGSEHPTTVYSSCNPQRCIDATKSYSAI